MDAGFLELLRLGIVPAADPLIVKSLAVVDKVIRVDTPTGPTFYRYNHDGYGEKPSWTNAQFIRLAIAIKEGKLPEAPAVVQAHFTR